MNQTPSQTAAYAAALREQVADNRHLFINVRSYRFRELCSDHNRDHGRYLSWATARELWRAANAAARRYVYRGEVR